MEAVGWAVKGAGDGGGGGRGGSGPSSLAPSEVWRVDLGLSAAQAVVHLSSGFLDPYTAAANRAQVVVAVTAGREVFCIDGTNGALLWSRKVGGQAGEAGGEGGGGEEEEVAAVEVEGTGEVEVGGGGRLLADDVAVLINPHPMRLNDSGVVVVGLRMWPSGHFSHFAFSGRAGLLRWSHDALDFQTAANSPPTVSSAHILHEAHEVHTGEVEWRNYRATFLQALPHQWAGARDSALQLVQVQPPHRQGSLGTREAEEAKRFSSRRASDSLSAALPSSSLLSVAASARWAHDDAEHLPHPNAVVAHTKEGVELLSFYTGRPLAHLALQQGQLHADLNGDGVIDHLQLHNGGQASEGGEGGGAEELSRAFAAASWLPSLSSCTAVVSSAIPPSSHLFNVSVCSNAFSRLLGSGFALGGARRGRGRAGGVGGIPSTQSMQGRRHLRLSRTPGGPGGRRRFPPRKAPPPLASASAAADDGSPAAMMADDRSEGEDETAADGGQGEGERDGDGGDQESAEWVTAPLALPPVQSPSSSSSHTLVLYFLSSQGLLTAVDGRGRKLFSTRTVAAISASTPQADQAAHRRLQRYDVKTDHSRVSSSDTSTT